MAFNDLTPLGMAQLGTSNQAAAIFNPDGPHPIRQKHLFVVRFQRADGTSDAMWKNGLSFVVKTMDRPTVQPVVEEINQYNKKRLIHTGVKYSPVSCSLFDTADGAAMNMWVDYARYHFGDYRQNIASYADDMLDGTMLDNSVRKDGYGYGIRPTTSTDLSGTGSQNFFKSIVVYQVWGNEYTSYELVNPRINSFAPDDLSYEASEASTIQMSFTYEAIAHGNSGRPQDLFTESTLTDMFAGKFGGKRLEVLGKPKINSFIAKGPIDDAVAPVEAFNDSNVEAGADEITRTTTSSEGGVLNRFGTYDFGTLDKSLTSPLNIGVSQALGGSSTLANLLGGSFSGTNRVFSGGTNISTTLDSSVGNATTHVDGLAQGIRSAAKLTGGNINDLVSREDGLRLANATVRGVNQVNTGTMQVGNKTSNIGPRD